MRKAVLVASLFLAGLPANAMRCGAHVVQGGSLPIEVLERCGEPVVMRSWVEHVHPRAPARLVDEWTYELGRHRFRRHLRFENGRLIRISTERKPRLRLVR